VFVGTDEYQVTLDSLGVLRLALHSNGTSANNLLSVSPNSTISFGTWQHIVFTYTGGGTPSDIQLYKDGVLVPTTTVENGNYIAMNAFSRPLVIGKASWGTFGYYNGYKDEYALFAAHFDLSDVQNIYNGGSPNNLLAHSKAANLRYWNRMGDGATFNKNWDFPDASGNGISANSINMELIDRTTDVP